MTNMDVISYIKSRLAAHTQDDPSLQADTISNANCGVMSGGYMHTATHR